MDDFIGFVLTLFGFLLWQVIKIAAAVLFMYTIINGWGGTTP